MLHFLFVLLQSRFFLIRSGFAGLGLLVTIVSFFQFGKLLNGNASPFALCYTIGNILSLCATMFLVGEFINDSLFFLFMSFYNGIACRSCETGQTDVRSQTMDCDLRVRS